MPLIHGTAEPRFSALKDAFAANFDSGLDIGAAVAVYSGGRLVADLWGGMADPVARKPWTRGTLVNIWSVTKAVMAVLAAQAVERGELHYDRPIAALWPDFAAGGKEAITLDQVMSHQSGLNGTQTPVDAAGLYAWDPYCAALAAQAPLWEPGSRCVYHALSYGHLVGEPLRRATGRRVGQLVSERLAVPLGLSLFVGLPQGEDHRAARLIAGKGSTDWVDEMLAGPYPHACMNPTLDPEEPNSRAWRAAEIPGANGQADARSLAMLLGSIAAGSSPVLSAEGLRRATAIRFDGEDAGFRMPARFGAGFAVGADVHGRGASRQSFGHTGWGGSFAFGDPEAGIGFAYVTNHMLGFEAEDPRRQALTDALWACL